MITHQSKSSADAKENEDLHSFNLILEQFTTLQQNLTPGEVDWEYWCDVHVSAGLYIYSLTKA